MKLMKAFFLVLALILYPTCTYAQEAEVAEVEEEFEDYLYTEDGQLQIPPGMEIRKVKGANLLVPKGGKIRKAGDMLIIEASDEYAARKIEEIEGILEKMGNDIEGLKKETELLKEDLGMIRKNQRLAAFVTPKPEEEKAEEE